MKKDWAARNYATMALIQTKKDRLSVELVKKEIIVQMERIKIVRLEVSLNQGHNHYAFCVLLGRIKICQAKLLASSVQVELDWLKKIISLFLEYHYCPENGTAEPVPCKDGTYQLKPGKETCIDCPSGHACVGGTKAFCQKGRENCNSFKFLEYILKANSPLGKAINANYVPCTNFQIKEKVLVVNRALSAGIRI